MKTRKSSIWLSCVYCGIFSALLWLLMSRVQFHSTAFAEEALTADPDAKASDESKRYEFRKKHDPDGTGRFYMGREIALVMGFQAATWLEREEREEEERLTELVRQLKLKPGQVVADIGAGSGVITMMMAQTVGASGKVFAVDIQQEMLDLLGDKISNYGITNIELIRGTDKSPKLAPNSIDLALMVDVYHEFAFPYETMLELSKALKPGGRVAFVEYRREDPNVPIKLVHKMSVAQIKKEIGLPEFRLEFLEVIKTLPRQHIVVFERHKD